MQLSARLERLLPALGVDGGSLPPELRAAAPFGQTAPDLDALARWLGARCAERPEIALPALWARPFDPLAARLRIEALRELARVDPAAAARHAAAAPGSGPLEPTLHLGALARASALAAAGAPEADTALLAIAPLLRAPRPVARLAALRLGEVGATEGPLGRRARALLEEALSAALQAAWDLGASGQLVALLDPELAELALPGMGDRAAAAAGRVVDLVAVLGGLAAHREGLTQRLSALAPTAPPFVAPLYVTAYLAALGAADRGPYLREVHERLTRAAADTEPRVRALAVEALGEPARAHPALAAALLEALTDADEVVRTAAALACAELGAVPDPAARELEDMIELGGPEAALAATRALARCARAVPERLLAELDDPVVQATARLLARLPGGDGHGGGDADADDRAFAALLEAYAPADPDEHADLDARLQPMAVLVEALRAMPAARAAGWLQRFTAGGADADALGQVLYHALDDAAPVPRELAEAGAPLLELLAGGPDDRAPLAALVAARLLPDEPRLEALLLERTAPPVSLLALAALERVSEGTAEHLLAFAEDAGEEHAALALAALGRCDLGAARAPDVAASLAAHVTDDDPLCEPAHAALVELAERGALPR